MCIDLFSPLKGDTRIYTRFYSGGRLVNSFTFHSYYEESSIFAACLEFGYGITKGDKVVIALGNSDKALIAYGALIRLGAVIVPIDPNSTQEEKEYILYHSDAVLLIEMKESDSLIKSTTFDEVMNYNKKEITLREIRESDSVLLVYTSGTTRRPKGVLLSYSHLLANAKSVKEHHSLTKETVLMSILPLFHVNAFNFSFFASFVFKFKLILNRNFYQPDFWNIVKEESVTLVSAVPKIITLLAQDRRKLEVKSETLRYFISAAAPLSTEIAHTFYKRYKVRVLQGYGMSEAVNFSLTMPVDLTKKTYESLLEEEILSVGVSIAGNEVKIQGLLDKECLENEIGEVVIRGKNVMQGYYKNEEETSKVIQNGWLHTGDLGFYLEKKEGRFFYLIGRKKEMILKNGENISPIELDFIIKQSEGLQESCVVGFENFFSGEEIGLFVVKNEKTPPKEQILLLLSKKFGKKAPKVIVFGKTLPTTSTGKVQRLKLVPLFKEFSNAML